MKRISDRQTQMNSLPFLTRLYACSLAKIVGYKEFVFESSKKDFRLKNQGIGKTWFCETGLLMGVEIYNEKVGTVPSPPTPPTDRHVEKGLFIVKDCDRHLDRPCRDLLAH